MAHHHKSNKAVEGDPDTGHRGGMPRRPDDAELEERTMEEREEIGLNPEPGRSGTERSAEDE
ncbi:hypothetical protein [Actinacidiphila rubida]|uniref:Uncharacterized protein n=1 Tax=Actinacidiphila rubida TaxID=310780 RepID=A0A1H8T8L8_9ACTN|nr:hypothetical protein [Actinacidiphila rubida]SEO86894.1 hypothetical protein SAMN05216267_10499 [Actinacidiphila rubida]